MKEVIYEWERATSGEFSLLGTHDLNPLWNRTRAALEDAWPDGDIEQLDRMGAIVAELAQIDEAGERFRYDRDRHGIVWDLPEELRRFDLRSVSGSLNKVLRLLGGALDGISDMKDAADA